MDLIPKVSVVIPVYNVEKYIQKSLESVLTQTSTDFELIVVNDGSQDLSMDILLGILQKTEVTYSIINQENSGQGAARNAGLDKARGEWVLFLDSDDVLPKNAIETMAKYCEPGVDFIFSKYSLIYDDNHKTWIKSDSARKLSKDELQMAFLQRKKVVLAPGTLYRKEFLLKNNLKFEKIPWSEDQYFIWNVLYEMNCAVFIDAEIYQYTKHSQSIMSSTSIDKIITSYEVFQNISKKYADVEIGRFILPRWVMGSINAATIMVDYQNWLVLWKAVEGRKNFTVLLDSSEKKVRLNAQLALTSPLLFYYLSRIRKRRQLQGVKVR